MNPCVSIIIPCFNAQNWVAEAVQSCLSQTYPHKEILVIDDGSTDKSWEVIKSFGDSIRPIKIAHQGAQRAKNHGLSLATGAYIQFLDADDYLEPEKLKVQMEWMQLHSLDVVMGRYRILEEQSKDRKTMGAPVGPLETIDYVSGIIQNKIFTIIHSYLYKAEVIRQIGGWSSQVHYEDDRLFNILIALSGAKTGFHKDCHAVWRKVRHHPSLSRLYLHSKNEALNALSSLEKIWAIVDAALQKLPDKAALYLPLIKIQKEKLQALRERVNELNEGDFHDAQRHKQLEKLFLDC